MIPPLKRDRGGDDERIRKRGKNPVRRIRNTSTMSRAIWMKYVSTGYALDKAGAGRGERFDLSYTPAVEIVLHGFVFESFCE